MTDTRPDLAAIHSFEPGVDVDMATESRSPDPRWCNVCGESHAVHDAALLAEVERLTAENARLWEAAERVKAVIARLNDYRGGFDQIRQERSDIADVLYAALASDGES